MTSSSGEGATEVHAGNGRLGANKIHGPGVLGTFIVAQTSISTLIVILTLRIHVASNAICRNQVLD